MARVLVPALMAVGMAARTHAETLRVVSAPSGANQFATLMEAAEASVRGDEIVVDPGTWQGVNPTDMTILAADTVSQLNSHFVNKTDMHDGGTQGVAIRSSGGALVTSLTDLSPVAARVAEATACSAQTSCRANTSWGLFLGSANQFQPIRVSLTGFTVHNFGFPGVYRCLSNASCSDYWGALDGGAFKLNYAHFTIADSIVHSNVALRGGAVMMYRSQLVVENTVFRDNYALESGGAIYVQISAINNAETDWAWTNGISASWDLAVSRSLFEGNEAGGEGVLA